MDKHHDKYLAPTYFINSDHPEVIEFSNQNKKGAKAPLDTAINLYYAVRDKIRYNPYNIGLSKEHMRASYILEQGQGYCVTKAVLLCACARVQNIPARLGFADVQNHLNTRKLREAMGTDVFIYHGYTELFLEGKWVKATPAFNLELCENFKVKPLEFDGKEDSIFHPLDQNGNKHMEYLKDRGTHADLPLKEIIEESVKWYPALYENIGKEGKQGDFHAEALKENQ